MTTIVSCGDLERSKFYQILRRELYLSQCRVKLRLCESPYCNRHRDSMLPKWNNEITSMHSYSTIKISKYCPMKKLFFFDIFGEGQLISWVSSFPT